MDLFLKPQIKPNSVHKWYESVKDLHRIYWRHPLPLPPPAAWVIQTPPPPLRAGRGLKLFTNTQTSIHWTGWQDQESLKMARYKMKITQYILFNKYTIPSVTSPQLIVPKEKLWKTLLTGYLLNNLIFCDTAKFRISAPLPPPTHTRARSTN